MELRSGGDKEEAEAAEEERVEEARRIAEGGLQILTST